MFSLFAAPRARGQILSFFLVAFSNQRIITKKPKVCLVDMVEEKQLKAAPGLELWTMDLGWIIK